MVSIPVSRHPSGSLCSIPPPIKNQLFPDHLSMQITMHSQPARCGPAACQARANSIAPASQRIAAFRSVKPSRRVLLDSRIRAEAEEAQSAEDTEELVSETERLRREAERLRAAERFMVVGTGEADCKGCGYQYSPKTGDPEYPVAAGTKFQNLPEDWQCPVCSAEKKMFVIRQVEVAGFAENQGYGLGTNTMTGEQKSLLIFGSLGAFFMLFISGYFLN